VVKKCSKIQVQDYDEMFTPVVYFSSSCLLLSIVATNCFVPQQLDVNAAFLYAQLKDTIYMHLLEDYRESNRVAYLNRCIYDFK
jgi:hypothetical protein